MPQWEDIQAEILRQDIADLQKLSKEAQGPQRKKYEDQRQVLEKQLAAALAGSSNGKSEITRSETSREQSESKRLKQKLGRKTRAAKDGRSSRTRPTEERAPPFTHIPHSGVADENAHLLKIAEDFAISVTRGDKEGSRKALGEDIIDANTRKLEMLLARLEGMAGSGSNKSDMKAMIENIDKTISLGEQVRKAFELRERVMWTILTVPSSRIQAVRTNMRITAFMILSFKLIPMRFARFRISQHIKIMHALRKSCDISLNKMK